MKQINNRSQRIVSYAIVCLFFCLTGAGLVSCNKALDLNPYHAASEEEQWNKIEDARSALMGIYGLTRAAMAENNRHWVCGDLRKGDFTIRNRADLTAVVNSDLLRSSQLTSGISNWKKFYAAINAASVFIERAPQIVEKDRSYSEANLEFDIAQARALRAFNYFYMVRIWGDVPLITQSYDNGSFKEFSKTAAQTVLNYAKGELREALDQLPYEFGTSQSQYYSQNPEYWRGMLFNKISAYATLAHIAAWESNYADAETYTAFILNHSSEISAVFTPVELLTTPTGLFNSETGLAIRGSKIIAFNFPFGARGAEATQTGHLEQFTLAYPLVKKPYPDIYVSKDSLYSIFKEVDDLRFGIDTATHLYRKNYITNMNAAIPIFSKINVIQNGDNTDGDYAVFGSALVFTRLEEISLLRAEALVALNRGAEAMKPYNDVRITRGFQEQSYKQNFGQDDQKLLNAIFEERRKELMGEGWRWYDQIRRQKIIKDNPAFLALIQNGGIYWPVAQDVLSENSQITQNTYWQ